MVKVNITNGTFRNGITAAHARFLSKISKDPRAIGTWVLLDSKERVEKIKPGAFCLSDDDRCEILIAVGVKVCVFRTEEQMLSLIREIHSSTQKYYAEFCEIEYFKGGDYTANEVTAKSLVENLGGKVTILPYEAGISTTNWIKELQGKK